MLFHDTFAGLFANIERSPSRLELDNGQINDLNPLWIEISNNWSDPAFDNIAFDHHLFAAIQPRNAKDRSFNPSKIRNPTNAEAYVYHRDACVSGISIYWNQALCV